MGGYIQYNIIPNPLRLFSYSTKFTKTNYYEAEPNGDYTVANKLEYDHTYSGYVTDSDKDFYKISIPKNAAVMIYFKHKYTEESNVQWTVRLYAYGDGEYNEIFSEDISGTDNEKVELFSLRNYRNDKYYLCFLYIV